MSDNRSRARRVEQLVESYCETAGLDAADPASALRCLLAEISHNCFRPGIRFDDTLRMARETFHEELQRNDP